MKKSRFSRVFNILTALQSEQQYGIDDFARVSGTSRRTIFRDLEELQKAGVPCYYDKKQQHYTIDPKFFFPAPALTSQEALGLLLLVYRVRNHINVPFKDAALKAAIKIENNLPIHIKRYCNNVLQNITVTNHPQTRTDLLDKIFAELQEAILKKRILKICYCLSHERKVIVTNLSPYHLMYNNRTWYVLGKSSFHKGIFAFELNNIRKLSLLIKCFVEDEKFDVNEYLGRAWSMTRENRLHDVKLKFLPEVAHSVAEVQWHSTQIVTFEDDGSAIVEFRIDGLNEITWWILGYGDRAEVLSPNVLRKKIVEITQKMVKTYQKEEKIV